MALVGELGLRPHAAPAPGRRPVPQPVAVQDPYARVADPAYYRVTKTVTLTNTGQGTAYGVEARIKLLPPPTPYARLVLTGASRAPQAVVRDREGNEVAIYQAGRLGPGRSFTVVLHYQAESAEVFYHLPVALPAYTTTAAVYRTFTAPALEAAAGVNTGAPAIAALDRALTAGVDDPARRAWLLFHWITEHIAYNYHLVPAGGALAVLRTRSGICSDFADLYTAMLRTDGIPARLVSGYVTSNGDGEGGFHQWVEFYLPRVGWVASDPTWGAYGYFAALNDNWHIPLYDGVGADVAVHWHYAAGPRPYVAIRYHYHFAAEPRPARTVATHPLYTRPLPAGARQALPGWLARLWAAVQHWWARLTTALVHLLAGTS
ncbi:TGc domain-containing protein [Candidatus Hydrogenisulfobacillus filiaventi]|uniref:TGc domain-containing protein n=1 Tax=Candidatus Hydrogenisulfobacillus filiaventi TaxID=2707344 RepID=A0A6F8ZKK0_9FIRM|nr:transglutaminase domain-containing protein [Bacillota bacterium]CAB1130196.1 TGc domain-containing protein [Candidatus Hydrogenisulfobacillus filiaventi]